MVTDLDAEHLVKATMDLVQVFPGTEVQYVTGFDPVGDDETSVLDRLNEFRAMLSPCRILQDEVTINFATGSRYADIPNEAIELLSMYVDGQRLRQTTREGLDAEHYYWMSATGNNPKRYFRFGANKVGVDKLSTSSYQAVLAYSKGLPVLTSETDTLAGLPLDFQYLFPYGAAVLLAVVDAENEAQVARINGYQTIVRKMIADLYRLSTGEYAAPMNLDQWTPKPVVQSPSFIGDRPYSLQPIMEKGESQ